MLLTADMIASVLVVLGAGFVRGNPERYEELLQIVEEQDSPELKRTAGELRRVFASEFAEPVVDGSDKLRRLRRIADDLKQSGDEELSLAGSGISDALISRGM